MEGREGGREGGRGERAGHVYGAGFKFAVDKLRQWKLIPIRLMRREVSRERQPLHCDVIIGKQLGLCLGWKG